MLAKVLCEVAKWTARKGENKRTSGAECYKAKAERLCKRSGRNGEEQWCGPKNNFLANMVGRLEARDAKQVIEHVGV